MISSLYLVSCRGAKILIMYVSACIVASVGVIVAVLQGMNR